MSDIAYGQALDEFTTTLCDYYSGKFPEADTVSLICCDNDECIVQSNGNAHDGFGHVVIESLQGFLHFIFTTLSGLMDRAIDSINLYLNDKRLRVS